MTTSMLCFLGEGGMFAHTVKAICVPSRTCDFQLVRWPPGAMNKPAREVAPIDLQRELRTSLDDVVVRVRAVVREELAAVLKDASIPPSCADVREQDSGHYTWSSELGSPMREDVRERRSRLAAFVADADSNSPEPGPFAVSDTGMGPRRARPRRIHGPEFRDEITELIPKTQRLSHRNVNFNVPGQAKNFGHRRVPVPGKRSPAYFKPLKSRAHADVSHAAVGSLTAERLREDSLCRESTREIALSQGEMSPRNLLTHRSPEACLPHETMAAVVQSEPFGFAASILVVMNALVIGFETDYHAQSGTMTLPWYFRALDQSFCVLFGLELLLRLWVHKANFFTSVERKWNIIDFVLVVLQALDEVAQEAGSEQMGPGQTQKELLQACRMIRLFRIFRIVRVMRFSEELRTILSTIGGSLRSFFWALVLLMMLLYGFGIFLTELVTECRRSANSDNVDEALMQYFGSMPRTVLTLFESVAGGLSWDAAILPMISISPWLAVAYCLYVAFCLYAVLNIVTGVFVNASLEYAHHEKNESVVGQMYQLFDVDGSGTVDLQEFTAALSRPELEQYFRELNVDVSYGPELFTVLDENGTNALDIDDFVGAMSRLRGPAKALELRLLHRQTVELTDLVRRLCENYAMPMERRELSPAL